MNRYLHGWAIFFARCARWIAAQQHRQKANPYYR